MEAGAPHCLGTTRHLSSSPTDTGAYSPFPTSTKS